MALTRLVDHRDVEGVTSSRRAPAALARSSSWAASGWMRARNVGDALAAPVAAEQ